MNTMQCPKCKGNRVSTMNECLVCHGCGHSEYLYDYHNAHDTPMADGDDPEMAELRERVDNLEALSAQRGSVPRRFHDEVQQLRGQVQYLHRKLAEQPPEKAQTRKYQDIKV